MATEQPPSNCVPVRSRYCARPARLSAVWTLVGPRTVRMFDEGPRETVDERGAACRPGLLLCPEAAA